MFASRHKINLRIDDEAYPSKVLPRPKSTVRIIYRHRDDYSTLYSGGRNPLKETIKTSGYYACQMGYYLNK